MKIISQLTAALSLLLLSFPAAAPAQQPTKPNILFIAIDDLNDWVHYLGEEQVKTPNLDRFASRCVTFTHAYCASPVCSIAARVLFSTTGTQRSALNLGSPGTR